ncbi:MAG: YggS family pyridoxal phosphate enzyme [Betaproteobacteria bacterium CG2_30_59_46]|nr:MAG: YggS family pyridoxal phosphate enzyme [Betaproteobacteria bacterium CG2_30_59_46]PIQ10026.1 MAG: YggS family pyridoxal phosphate-dependent enzyme [Hydrogenophilales bacterium CG18_big_fil_WC_8_21_14_2_50_58_12]PIY01772.1 MAG: YggS family pyridoxal phosphate-dependent enzyme [Hydrogenophilales bacterium CG_4_10_14_3_um_filter_58_23]PJB03917.1 MAG: YggS family pyridoxal phosphate-dependent enzyme [Hydrogenophilales bacterium CG_4_9_14_3_um_filter_59_35]
MTTIASALQAVRSRIALAATAAGRPVASIQLLAVSKTFPADAVRQAYTAGQRAFGESYVQEAVGKVEVLNDLPLRWHFIGPIQSNKTRPIAENFAWVHSLDRARIADRLSAGRPSNLPDLQVCLQVNVSGESSKSGVAPEDLPALARHVRTLPRLKLRGLMAIPEPTDDPVKQRLAFVHLRQILEQLNAAGFHLDTLSMGMSDDFEAAIAEGATIVRVGSAIFGEREKA